MILRQRWDNVLDVAKQLCENCGTGAPVKGEPRMMIYMERPTT